MLISSLAPNYIVFQGEKKKEKKMKNITSWQLAKFMRTPLLKSNLFGSLPAVDLEMNRCD